MAAPCPLCQKRPAKRGCPALTQDICTVCCATKRRVEIRCPNSCPHLAAGDQFPAAAVKRQRDADLHALLAGAAFSELQMQVFFLVQSHVVGPTPAGVPALLDAEVADAAAALAATYETASRGIIFEHAATTRNGQRLVDEIRPVLADAGRGGGSRFERDAATVLKFIAASAAPAAGSPPTRYVDIVRRVMRASTEIAEPAASGLILPG